MGGPIAEHWDAKSFIVSGPFLQFQIDLKDICEVFEAKYGQTLYDTIVSETSGDYQHTLLCLIKGGYFPKE